MIGKRILCFGDSLTWGWMPVPEVAPTTRFSLAERWTGVMAATLGDGYEVVEEGLSGRTTSADDPVDPRLNGSAYLPACLASHLPLDLVIIMLGTNDAKSYYSRSPFDIALGMCKLVGQVLSSMGGVGTSYPAPKALIVAPPPLGDIHDPWCRGMFDGGHEKTRELAALYAALAQVMQVGFFDAGGCVSTGGVDGVHLTADNNRVLGLALAAKVRAILGG